MTTAAETKNFDPAVLASITTGIVLVEGAFSPMHEAAEWIMGHPIWTHEFASKSLWQKMSAALLAQLPDLPTEATPENYTEVAERARSIYGEMVAVARGSEERTADPITTAIELTGGNKPIVAIVSDEAA